MKNKLLIYAILIILMMISSSFMISAEKINSSKNKNKESTSSVEIQGEITGLIFDIHAYYIVDGIDNSFHRESWECTITEESGINFYVPKPNDQRDHYQITGELEGYKSKTVDFYVTPSDDWKWVQVTLTPIKSKSINPVILNFLNFFPMFYDILKI